MAVRKHECTGHIIKLCPKSKLIVQERKAKILHQTNISEVVNLIIEEYSVMKKSRQILK